MILHCGSKVFRRVNDGDVVADGAAYVDKRNSARKSANIRSNGPAAANGDTFGQRHIAPLQRQWSTATVRSPASCTRC